MNAMNKQNSDNGLLPTLAEELELLDDDVSVDFFFLVFLSVVALVSCGHNKRKNKN